MWFHCVQSVHELLQLPFEAAAHTAELVALTHLAAGTLQQAADDSALSVYSTFHVGSLRYKRILLEQVGM